MGMRRGRKSVLRSSAHAGRALIYTKTLWPTPAGDPSARARAGAVPFRARSQVDRIRGSARPTLLVVACFGVVDRRIARRGGMPRMCRRLLEGEEHLRTFFGMRVIGPTNRAADRVA